MQRNLIGIRDVIEFGRYSQDADGTVRPLKWRILDQKGNAVLIITEVGIDSQPYHKRVEKITWENSSLRYWLNHNFLDAAFTDAEKSSILLTDVTGEGNTKDQVFLLSDEEACRKYFDSNEERMCKPTEYAIQNGAYSSKGCCWWWLRTPSNFRYYATFVYYDGSCNINCVCNHSGCVRPALWMDLKALKRIYPIM